MPSWDSAPPVVAFLCSWAPYRCYLEAEKAGPALPEGLRVVKVPCGGRIEPGLILSALEKGAAGVVVATCREGECRHGTGPAQAGEAAGRIAGLVRLLGLGPERFRMFSCSAHEPDLLVRELSGFALGLPGPARKRPEPKIAPAVLAEPAGLGELIREYRIFHCLDCGKCAGACPLAQAGGRLSPRLMADRAVQEGLSSDLLREGVWSCLTCGLCTERCPSGIDFSGFVAALRPLYRDRELSGQISHGGTLQTLMRLQARPEINQNRPDWLDPELKTAERGEVLFFSGCLPYFQTFFSYLDLDLTGIGNAAVKILNRLGVVPAMLPGERCCGHDLYYGGDRESFARLRELNLAGFRKAGAKTVVTVCPECAHALGGLYGKEMEGIQVLHLAQFLAGRELPLKRTDGVVTFQDPCRLARFLGITAEPRGLLGRVAEVREMAHFGRGAFCCGNSAWIGCGRAAKEVQAGRFAEAARTGARVLATACPKCLIHLSCAQRDLAGSLAGELAIRDLSVLIAASLEEDRGALKGEEPDRP